MVVNCAGVISSGRVLGRQGPHDLKRFADVVTINLIGTFNVMRLAAAAMAQNNADSDGQRGLIVCTSSIAAYEGQIGQVAYAASKGGVAAMTLAAARDLADVGIRVCSIAPGIVATPMMDSLDEVTRSRLADSVPFPHRFARPHEFAKLVSALVDNDYVNGEVIRIDGGLRMAPS